MKRLLIFIILILTCVNAISQQTQIDVKKAVVRNWIIYQGDTLAVIRMNGDSIFYQQGVTVDTVVISGTNYWTLDGSDNISNNNAGYVTLNGQVFVPDIVASGAKYSGNVAGIGLDDRLFPKSIIDLFNEMQDTTALMPTSRSTWVRDSTNGILYTANDADKLSELKTNERMHAGMVTFSFDDGMETDYTVMFPLFTDKGVPGVSNIITSAVGGANIMTWEEIIELQNAGWEIASHSTNHATANNITYDSMLTIYGASKTMLESHGIIVNNMAYPGNVFNDSAMIAARKFYRSSRSGITGGTGDTINTFPLNTYSLTSYSLVASDSSTMYSLIDRVYERNGWLIFYLHQTDHGDSILLANAIDTILAKGMQIVTVNQALDIVGNNLDLSDGFAVNNDNMRVDGIIYKKTTGAQKPYIHSYSDATAQGGNTFFGYNSGNLTMSPAGGASYLSSGNTGIGYYALVNLTTGYGNTSVGKLALRYTRSGYYNTSVGSEALTANTTGYSNTAIGNNAAINNISGYENTYLGDQSGYYHTGNKSTFIGFKAGRGGAGNAGLLNVAVGHTALYSVKSGRTNVAIGASSMFSDTNGIENTALGYQALYSNTSGNAIVAVGFCAGLNTKGSGNSFIGHNSGAGASGSTGTYNVALGYESLKVYSSSSNNVAIGTRSQIKNTTGGNNTAIGAYSGYSNSSGAQNVFIGYRGGYNETGSYKYYLAADSTSFTNGMASGSKLLIYGDMSNADKANHYIDLFGKVSIGAAKAPSYMLDVTGTGFFADDLTLDDNMGFVGAGQISTTGNGTLTLDVGTGRVTVTNDLAVTGNIVDIDTKVTAGYTLPIFVGGLTSPADATTYYFGNIAGIAPSTTADERKMYIPKSGTITFCEIATNATTAGTNEAWPMYIRLNNTTDYEIATLSVNTNLRMWKKTDFSITVAAGDYIEIKTVTPTWATNPATLTQGGYIYIEQ